MTSTKNINHLFNSSGCLSTETMLLYLDHKLTGDEEKTVKDHLSSCEFCADALEGFADVADRTSIQPAINQINTKIISKVKAQTDRKVTIPRTRTSRRTWTYVSAAASVALLIGLFFIFNQIVNERSGELAMIPDTTIGQEESFEPDTPVYEENIRSAPKETDNLSEHSDQTATVVGGIMKVSDEEAGSGEAVQYDDDVETDALAETDKEIPEIQGIEATEITQYEVMGVESPEPLTGLAAQAGKDKEEIVLGEVAIETADEIAGVMTGKSDEDKKSLRTKNKKERAGRYASAQNNREALTAGYVAPSDDSTIFTVVEDMPEFKGGDEALFSYINDSLNYPEKALREKIEGTVIVSFIIEKDGSLSDIQILRPLTTDCDEEALRLVRSMPNWKPGKQLGEPVRVFYTLPIEFNINF